MGTPPAKSGHRLTTLPRALPDAVAVPQPGSLRRVLRVYRWFADGAAWVRLVGGAVEPPRPTLETSPAAHIAVTVRAFSRRRVSQPKLWVCSQVRSPEAAEAAARAQPAHMASA
jgi:hypothetical protein